MLLSRVVSLAGISILSTSASENDLGTTLSTKYIEHSPDSETTYSTSWRTKYAPSVTRIGEDDGWTVISETETPATDTRETSTDNGTSPQPTSLRPNNAMVAHRMAMLAGATWGRFPNKPDNETEACVNNTTIDDGTQGIRYDNSTVNCTALMFGDRWHRWECDEACRTTLSAALPAAILSFVSPGLADSDAVQRSIRATRELLGRRVSFLRLGRFSMLLRRAESYLGGLFRQRAADLEFAIALWEPIRLQLELYAGTFRLTPAATNRVLHAIWELQLFHADIQLFPEGLDFPDGLPDPLTPEYFDTTEEYENYIRRLLEMRELRRRLLEMIEDLDPILEEAYRREPDLPEELVERLFQEIALPQYNPEDNPPVYEDPPAYGSREYRAEQDLYDSMSWLAESPPNPEEIRRFGRYNSWPTSVPVTNIPEPTIPVSPTVAPTIAPTEVPVLPPDTPETSRIDLAQDGTLTIDGSGAWATAAEISLTLLNRLTSCTPLDIESWTFIPRSTSFLAHAKIASWNGPGVEQCFAKEISGLGGPSAENIVTQGFKEYDLKIDLEINPKKPPVEEGTPNRGPPDEEGPGGEPPNEEGPGIGPPEEEGPPRGRKKLPKCKWWQAILGYQALGKCWLPKCKWWQVLLGYQTMGKCCLCPFGPS